jgi:hypothetical protein
MTTTTPDSKSLTVVDSTDRLLAPGRKLSVREAASHLGVSKSFLDKKRLSGDGPAFLKLGRRVLYEKSDLEG